MTKDSLIQQAFEVAAERYAAVGVDVRKALEDMKKIVYGGLVREKETGAFTFSRMTVKQYGYFTREEDARFLVYK